VGLTVGSRTPNLGALPEIVPLPSEKLITTPTLNQIHCSYNTRYGLFVCNLCKVGVPARLLHNHASAAIQSVKIQENNRKVGKRTIAHGFSVGRNVIDTIKVELQQKLEDVHLTFLDAATDGRWAETPVALPGQQGGIMGLDVHSGFGCGSCHYASLSKHTIDTHRSEMKRNGDEAHHRKSNGRAVLDNLLVQTFSYHGNAVKYFKVSTPTLISEAPEERVEASNTTSRKVSRLRQRKMDTLEPVPQPSDAAIGGRDMRGVLAFFRDTGVEQFLKMFDRQHLLTLISLPHLNAFDLDPALRRLYKLVVDSYMGDCEDVYSAATSFRFAIMNCSPYVKISSLHISV
jgi:hypothetical protein